MDVDGHAKVKKWGATIYPNLALCKIAAYHKDKGDSVEWYTPFADYDIVYMSRIFNFSEDYTQCITNARKIVRGGTGYDITAVLPKEIDDHQPDYSIYPQVPTDISYGFLSRGCPNKCKWCVVPVKEGAIKPYWDIDRVANGNKKIVLMDNNILACGDYCTEQLQKIITNGYKVDFNQALDARLVTPDNAKLLAQIKWLENRIRFGCDTKAQIADCERAIQMICEYGYNGEFFLYTMLHGTFEECYNRIHYWWERNRKVRADKNGNRVYPCAQPYRDLYSKNTPPQWQKDLARWCNKRQTFTICDFAEFSPRKGFVCQWYIDTAMGTRFGAMD